MVARRALAKSTTIGQLRQTWGSLAQHVPALALPPCLIATSQAIQEVVEASSVDLHFVLHKECSS